jgi:hypothetical protein
MRRLGIPLNIGGGRPLGTGINTKEWGLDWEEMKRQEEAEYIQKIQRKRERCVGPHDTGLPCVCGAANIIDHAEDYRPRTDPSQMRFGPDQRTPRQKYEQLAFTHAYWCETCGLAYKNSVIEAVRGYIPPENLPEPSP